MSLSSLPVGWITALGLSALLNIGCAYLYLQQRDAAVTARTQLSTAQSDISAVQAAADVCNASIDALYTSAGVLAKQLEGEREAAKTRAGAHYAKADKILSTPAAVLGDACASAQGRVRQILADRKKGGA